MILTAEKLFSDALLALCLTAKCSYESRIKAGVIYSNLWCSKALTVLKVLIQKGCNVLKIDNFIFHIKIEKGFKKEQWTMVICSHY